MSNISPNLVTLLVTLEMTSEFTSTTLPRKLISLTLADTCKRFNNNFQDSLMLTTAEMMDVFDHLKSLGCVVNVHAENGEIIAENEKRLLARGITGPGETTFQLLHRLTIVLDARSACSHCGLSMRVRILLKLTTFDILFLRRTGETLFQLLHRLTIVLDAWSACSHCGSSMRVRILLKLTTFDILFLRRTGETLFQLLHRLIIVLVSWSASMLALSLI